MRTLVFAEHLEHLGSPQNDNRERIELMKHIQVQRRIKSLGRVAVALVAAFPVIAGVEAFANDALPLFDQGGVLTVTEENDFVNRTDRWYTQGAKISYLTGDQQVPGWTHRMLEHVPALGFSTGAERIGLEIGQSIFTPENIETSRPLPNDRPYAGWLYGGMILQRRGFGAGDFLNLENLELQLGIIGPESFADHMQTWWHHRAPQGWENQLEDEFGVALRYGRAWLIPLPDRDRHYVDLVPHGGLSVGNVDTSFRAAVMLRAGWNMPDDFGVQTVDSVISTEGGLPRSLTSRRWGFYVFTAAEGRAVLYTAFLDGNMFQDSMSIDKEPLVGEWRSGLVVQLHRVELAYTHVFRTPEFDGQNECQIFGSFTVKVNF